MEKRTGAARLPDVLTLTRVFLVPVLLWLLTRVRGPALADPARLAAVATALAIGLSDFLDGLLARRLGVTSARGAVLDAAADKLATLLPLFYWAVARPDAFPPVPLWLPLTLFVLDASLAVSWIGARSSRKGHPEPIHNQVGRGATLVAFLLVGGITLGVPAGLVVPMGALLVVLRAVAVAGYVRTWFL